MLTHSVKTIKLFRRAFLKPITSRPTQGTCDLTSLFDLEGLYVEDIHLFCPWEIIKPQLVLSNSWKGESTWKESRFMLKWAELSIFDYVYGLKPRLW